MAPSCRTFGPGEMLRCPHCGKALAWAGPRTVVTVCPSRANWSGIGELRTCPNRDCATMLTLEFGAVDASAPT